MVQFDGFRTFHSPIEHIFGQNSVNQFTFLNRKIKRIYDYLLKFVHNNRFYWQAFKWFESHDKKPKYSFWFKLIYLVW